MRGSSYVRKFLCVPHLCTVRTERPSKSWSPEVLLGAEGILVPPRPAGVKYVGAAAGRRHWVLTREDGVAVAFGQNLFGQCDVPASFRVAAPLPFSAARPRRAARFAIKGTHSR